MQEYNLAVTTLINLQALVFNYQGLLTLKVAFFKQGDVLQETVNKTQNINYQFKKNIYIYLTDFTGRF